MGLLSREEGLFFNVVRVLGDDLRLTRVVRRSSSLNVLNIGLRSRIQDKLRGSTKRSRGIILVDLLVLDGRLSKDLGVLLSSTVQNNLGLSSRLNVLDSTDSSVGINVFNLLRNLLSTRLRVRDVDTTLVDGFIDNVNRSRGLLLLRLLVLNLIVVEELVLQLRNRLTVRLLDQVFELLLRSLLIVELTVITLERNADDDRVSTLLASLRKRSFFSKKLITLSVKFSRVLVFLFNRSLDNFFIRIEGL